MMLSSEAYADSLWCFVSVSAVTQVEDDFTVPLLGVERAVLEKVVEFLKLYHAEPMNKIEKVRRRRRGIEDKEPTLLAFA
jgi:hypothetical protein